VVRNRTPSLSATARSILAVAERLAQTKGFNGFSYADIAEELQLTKATLHYHFASKAELGRVLVVRYEEAFSAALERIETEACDPLERYVCLFEDVLVRDRMCLCGMLAAEYSTLPTRMQAELRRFFDRNETWLARQLERARARGKIRFEGSALEAARTLTASLEGAMLLARSYEEPARFTATARGLLRQLRAPEPRRAARRA
jgi:TetR/AcrR family transcriptional repressor of nem operon